MTQDETEAFVAGGLTAMRDAIAAQPYRADPGFADLFAAAEALLRYLAAGPSVSGADETEAEAETKAEDGA